MEKKTFFTIVPSREVNEILTCGLLAADGSIKVFLNSKNAEVLFSEFVSEDENWTLIGIQHEGILGSILSDENAKLKMGYRFIILQNKIDPNYLRIHI